MKTHVEVAREFMTLMREFRQPNPENGEYDGMHECDVRDLAQGAALLIEAAGKVLPRFSPIDGNDEAERLRVRISNLEAQNDGLRVNNEALRASNNVLIEAAEKALNPEHVVIPKMQWAAPGSGSIIDDIKAGAEEMVRVHRAMSQPGDDNGEPGTIWVKLKRGNDWGVDYFAIEPLSNGHADQRRGIQVDEGDPVRVRTSDGAELDGLIALRTEHGSVSDHGHWCATSSEIPEVAFIFHGQTLRIRIDELEVDEAWARSKGAQ